MFMYTYSLFKRWSGILLENAENIILEVGEPYEEEEECETQQGGSDDEEDDEDTK